MIRQGIDKMYKGLGRLRNKSIIVGLFGSLVAIMVVFFLIMRTMFGGRGSMNCGSHGADSSPTESARNLLDKRFARGELTKDEYEEMRKTLSSGTR